MSMPSIPDMNPNINLNIEDSAKLLFNSIAMEEIGLSHIVNAEGEKLQYILGTLKDEKNSCSPANTCELLKVNKYVDRILREVLKNQMVLQMKMEDTMDLYESASNDYFNDINKNYCKNADKNQKGKDEWKGEGVEVMPFYNECNNIKYNKERSKSKIDSTDGISCTMIEF